MKKVIIITLLITMVVVIKRVIKKDNAVTLSVSSERFLVPQERTVPLYRNSDK